jgi:ABC-type polysaccharide transport system permease subunit
MIHENAENVRKNLKIQKKKQVRLAKKLSFLVGFLIFSYLPFFYCVLCFGVG